jgi:hypothetical protein
MDLPASDMESGDGGDEDLLKFWHGKLTHEIRTMRDCGPLEAMQKLDSLVRSAVLKGGPEAARALGLAWVRVLAGPPESLTVPVIRAAGSLHISGVRGPLLAHLYGDGFWPALAKGDLESRFTDMQRRAVLLALSDLVNLFPEDKDMALPMLEDWLIRRAIPLWRSANPGPIRRLLARFIKSNNSAVVIPLANDPEPADPVHALTLRELRSHAFVLGYLVPRDQADTYATLLAHCPVPIKNSEFQGEPIILTDGLHAEFLRGWLTRRHQYSLKGHPERIIQMVPRAFASDGHLHKRIASELENDFARRPNPLGPGRDSSGV